MVFGYFTILENGQLGICYYMCNGTSISLSLIQDEVNIQCYYLRGSVTILCI